MKPVVFVFAMVLVVGLLGIVSLTASLQSPSGGHPTMSSNSSQIIATTFTTTQTSNSKSPISWPLNSSLTTNSQLRFELFLNSTSFKSGNGVMIGTGLFNVESQYNNISSAADWPPKTLILNALVNCGVENYPLGLAIILGRYTSNNISSASSLYLWNPTVPNNGCPPFSAHTYFYVFNPRSDLALPSGLLQNSLPEPMDAIFEVNGYWTGSGFNTGVFHYFGPGTYTLLAGDEWGDILFLYFTVV